MKRRLKPAAPLPARLFAEPERAASRNAHVANIDGAARNNPGPAAYGVIMRNADGQVVFQVGKYLGRATNNVAEYFALITALDYAQQNGIASLRVRSDSELLVRQMQGAYKVKSASLRPLHERARKLSKSLASFVIEHVPREQNREADALANAALDETSGGTAPSREIYLSGRRFGNEQEYARAPRRIRALYRRGALYPAEPLDVPEDTEVEITIQPAKRT